MKILYLNVEETKKVKYFNLTLDVDPDTYYIAIDENGECWGFSSKPIVESNYWTGYGSISIGSFDLEGVDWKLSLRSVN